MFSITKKKCTKCEKKKTLSEFYVDKRGVRSAKCKTCHNEHSRSYNKSHRDQRRQTQTRYRLSHPEKVLEMFRTWYSGNLDAQQKALANARKWEKNNPDRVRQLGVIKRNKRRALKAGNGGKITAAEWQALKEHYEFTCLRCERREPEIKLTLDHVLPLVLGGENTIKNAQPLCLSCNDKKGKKHIDYRGRK